MPDPTLCTACPHKAHEGWCNQPMESGVPCGCNAASESAERPDGWYWVKFVLWRPAWWSKSLGAFDVWRGEGRFLEKDVTEIGPRIPSPDDPPCPISAQRVRDIAGEMERKGFDGWAAEVSALADWIAKRKP